LHSNQIFVREFRLFFFDGNRWLFKALSHHLCLLGLFAEIDKFSPFDSLAE
jgi:hypothetical protein